MSKNKIEMTSSSHIINHRNSGVEHYTPKAYMIAVHEVMGGIDLDPASCFFANKNIVRADLFYDKSINGLLQRWFGRVYVNPPYGKTSGKSNSEIWLNKLINEYRFGDVKEAILLVNANVSEKWYKPIWDFTICITDHRIKFLDSAGNPQRQPRYSNSFVYFGNSADKFHQVFERFGTIIEKRNMKHNG